MSITYRILTEDVNTNDINEIVSQSFDGFTCYKATGYWRGIPEQSLIIEVMSDIDCIDAIRKIAQDIKVMNKQESVLVQVLNNNHWFI